MRRGTFLRAGALVGLAGLAACDSEGTPSARPSGTPTSPGSPSSSATSADPSPGETAEPPVEVRPAIAGELSRDLAVPWGITFLPDGRALVSMRDTAEVLLVGPEGADVIGTVPGVVSGAAQGGEGGLLGLALHPSYPDEPWLYAYVSTASDNRVVRMRYAGSGLGEPEPLLTGIATSVHHNGGGLVFGAEGLLFVSTGDAENSASAQDRESLNGKVLRITDTGGTPQGNPFGNPVWSYGHRNVEGITLDEDGRLWASEFGEDAADELNLIEPGGNYGWPQVEGTGGGRGLVDPLATWLPDDCSPSGIAVAQGRAWLGALQGQCVFSVELDGDERGTVRRHLVDDRLGRVRAVALAPDGSLWVGTSNRDGRATPGPHDDKLLRVTLT
ncbi:PQQ-dependent sugar dehydrogenase [Nocardioides sp. KIGAM211]|uniref:PQQ-dependent sugar dehydrogenase n=2 Tax=Nocardioides luti TaxID=2761101 RepID=A0A7X0RIN6_9ACTN|nr:PQQ-dependent sugar dehydrogenase [Nocardioides luti]MBB6627769.1 PQQ-dependent sugar dehydrogenase [Nocardioides luti]